MPAAIISKVDNGKNYATQHNLTYLQTELLRKMELSSEEIAEAITAEIPTTRAENTQFHIFRPSISGEEH